MSEYQEIGLYSLLWIFIFTITFVIVLKNCNRVGLTITFMITFLTNHWLASALYCFPAPKLFPASWIISGLWQSLIGITAFAFGALILGPIVSRSSSKQTSKILAGEDNQKILSDQIKFFLFVGLLFSLTPDFLQQLALVSLLVRVLSKLTLLAACLFVYQKIVSGSTKVPLYMILIALLFPVIGLIGSGFLSFGTLFCVLVVSFYLSYSKLNAQKIILLMVITYLGLSIFVAYLDNRANIRNIIWGRAPILARVQVIKDTLLQIEPFSPYNSRHFSLIDSRLNLNYFVGVAAYNLDQGFADYGLGETFFNALIAPIPRVLWPDKPVISGGSAVVTKYTGIVFYGDTSTGIGPLFEGFINFGSVGVAVLFLLYGITITIFDTHCRQSLETGKFYLFGMWFLTGIQLANPDDSTASVIGAMISTFLVLKAFQIVIFTFKQKSNRKVIVQNIQVNNLP